MKKIIKQVISITILIAIISGLLPITEIRAAAASEGVASISNEYIAVDVSEKNGGFLIRTNKGDKLVKSDDNKRLLYHNGEYDTSFTSFEITYADGSKKTFLFGGSYGFLGMRSSDVEVTKVSESEIKAVWKLDDLVFTQNLTLVSAGANEHGMVSISYDVENNGSSAVSVKARILLDTAFDDQDYGYYQVIDANDKFRSIKNETVITELDNIPQNFFAYDDPYDPSVTAYTVNKQGQLPYQVAFGHWNSLASSLFTFAPDATIDFCNPNNKYMTADSAYALYYDMGTVSASGGRKNLITYYGVYSHYDTPIENTKNTMVMDITAPTALTLNSNKDAYERLVNKGIADFSVQMNLKNVLGEKEVDYDNVTLAIYTSIGLKPLNANGEPVDDIDYDNTEPYRIAYPDVKAGEIISDIMYFSARPSANAEYRKIKLQVFDTSTNSSLTEQNMLAEREFYILCPGTDGDLPKFTFTSLTPDMIYYSGTRHLFLTGTNIDYLYASIQSGNCTIKAYTKGKELTIPRENILQPAPDKLDIILTEDMVTGDWYLQLEWSEEAVDKGIVPEEYKKQTAPALNFVVSNDKRLKNDVYGVIAVVQLISTEPVYRIMSFRNEEAFQSFKEGIPRSDGTKVKEYEEILLEFRGEFEIKESVYDSYFGTYMPTKVKATSNKPSVDSKATNCITINNCIDFEAGVMDIYYLGTPDKPYGDIMVLFDGSLYTSDARTSIWKGEAGLTKIVQGEEFSLIPYSTDGERDEDFKDNPITLVWPSVLGTAQTIAGMAFNLAYGRLGVMKNDDGKEVGRLISFGAKLDLGFLIPGKKDDDDDKKEDTYWSRIKAFWRYYKYGERGEYADWLYCNYDKFPIPLGIEKKGDDDDDDDDDDKEKSLSVMVEDILYGCGKGFIGVHFKAEIGLPNYVEGMPKIKGELEVNTIGNWMFGLEGEMKMETFEIEVALTIKSYKNIPVPDKIYFFITGFEPGINIDTFGVIWITGGGGGIDNIYDTIFLTSAVPPLKILMSVTFDIIKVLSARCDFTIGPRGISFKASDIKIKSTNIIALKKAAMQFDWYPNLYIMGSIWMSLADLIEGGGYIVLEGKDYSEWFFEAFVRAAVKVPKSIPFIGGMTVSQVDLGINTEKIWGQLKVLKIEVGITYYWHEGLHIGAGELSAPTYPNLLGYDDIPIYYDEESGETLYMRVGTNISIAAQPEITDDLDNTFRLMGDSAAVYSSADRKNHKINLGIRGDSDALIEIRYAAGSLDEATKIAENIIKKGIKADNGKEYKLTLYDGNNIDSANANVTYDEETGMGALSFSMTEEDCYGIDWNVITDPYAAEIILYNVAEVPEIKTVNGTVSGNELNVSWDGTLLGELDSVKFYLVSDANNIEEGGYPIGEINDTTIIRDAKNTSFTIPSDIPEGRYYIRAVYSKEGIVNNAVVSTSNVFVRNDKTPDPADISKVEPAGDYKFNVTLGNTTADVYIVNVYEYDTESNSWVNSDISGIVAEKASILNNTITVGGKYVFTDNYTQTSVVKGLVAGKEYRIGVIACNYVDSDNDGEPDSQVFSTERFYSISGSVTSIDDATSVSMPEPTPPNINVTADKVPVKISREVGSRTETFDTYASPDITFTVSADKDMTGTWTLDGESGVSGSVAGKTVSIPLKELEDGDHTLVIKGTGPSGDSFRHEYSFTVDTLAPRLLLSSPTNGSFYNEDGTLTVTGITDRNARFSVFCDNIAVYSDKTVEELGGTISSDGVFTFDVLLPNAHDASKHEVVVTVSDEVGNITSVTSEVVHGGLSNIDFLEIYADSKKWENNNIVNDELTSKSYQLSLRAKTKSGVSFYLTDEKLISWTCNTVKGTATVDSDGKLTIGPGSIGYVTGALRVAETGSLTASMTFGAEIFSFNTTYYSVATSATPGGTVTGGGSYLPGDTVTLTATPDSGYYFTGWTLEGVGVGDTKATTITFTMPAEKVTATANFAPKRSVTTNATNGGSVTGGGLYIPGDTVTLKAVPESGYRFTSWTLEGVTVDDTKAATITFTMPDGNVVAKANFEKEELPPVQYQVETKATEGGSVSGGGMYVPGETVTLTATPYDGYYFTGWKLEGVTVSDTKATTITFKMPEGKVTATANFAAQYSVITNVTNKGTVTGGGKYTPGDKVTLTATPDSGYYFTGWTLEGVNVDDTKAATITFTMPDGNVAATANFEKEELPPVQYKVEANATKGGTVTGGGLYTPGDTVTLTATPKSGYRFTGWKLEGVSVSDTKAATITFTMPEGNVTATANFVVRSSGGSSGNTGVEPSDDNSEESPGEEESTDNQEEEPTDDTTYSLAATSGQKVIYRIPSTVNADNFVPYYLVDGKKVYVPMSINENGKLTFIAPVSGKYYFEECDISFTDIKGHWAENNIKSAAARGLFKGTGDGKFDPNGQLTREMFVTVLWRLAGSPAGGECSFEDYVPNAYYSEALAWAANNSIVSGYGNGIFGVNDEVSREQLCVIIVNYLKYIGFDLSNIAEGLPFSDDENISSWAKQSVNICRSLGLIKGKEGNMFDPKATSTRAECSTVFLRLIKYILQNIKIN